MSTTAAPGRPEPVFTVSGATRQGSASRRAPCGPGSAATEWAGSGRSPGGHPPVYLVRPGPAAGHAGTGGNRDTARQAAALATLAAPGDSEQALAARAQAARAVGPCPGPAWPGDVPAALVIRAAEALDAPLLVSTFTAAFARHGVTAGWEQLAVPALRELGARPPHAAGHGAAEHMLSGCLLATLLDVIARAPAARALRPVLLGCADEEQHVLPVYALHAELSGGGVNVRQLGGRVPSRRWPMRSAPCGRPPCSSGPRCPTPRTRPCWPGCLRRPG